MEAMAWVLPILLALATAAENPPSSKLAAARELKQRESPADAAKAYDALLPEVLASGDECSSNPGGLAASV
jgi:hypothetical protein